MKKYFLTVVMALFIGSSMYAQTLGQGERKEWNPEMIAQRKAAQLMLDDATVAKFTPLYQEYMNALKEARGTRTDRQAKNEMTDEEMDKQMQERFDRQQKCLDVQKKYYDKFKKILTMRQVQMLYQNGPAFGPRPGRKVAGPHAGKKQLQRMGQMPCQQGNGICQQKE